MTDRRRFAGIEAARFYAAAAIIIFHVKAMYDIPSPPELSFVETGFGQGVPLFFIISAFGMCAGYMSALETREQVREYYLRRLLRIAPLFYFISAIYVAFWTLTGYSAPKPVQFIATALFINNLFPQTVTGSVWGSWTIGVEMLFYLVFPALAVLVNRWWKSVLLLVLAAVLQLSWRAAFSGVDEPLASFATCFIANHFVWFAAGIVAWYSWSAVASSSRSTLVGNALLSAATLGLVGLLGWATLVDARFQPVLWALALGGLVVGLALSPHPLLVGPRRVALGRASFGLYLWHLMIIGLLNRIGMLNALADMSPNTWITFGASVALTFAIVIPLALLSFRYIEQPGIRAIRYFIQSQHHGSGPPELGGQKALT